MEVVMSIQVNWDNPEHTIIRYQFERSWTWNDFFAAVRTAKGLIDAAPAERVGVIMEGQSRHMQFPPNMLTHFKNALRNRHQKTEIVAVVIDNAFLRVIVNSLIVLTGSSKETLQITEDLEQARAIVQAYLETRMLEE
jgi:hypothetical protein